MDFGVRGLDLSLVFEIYQLCDLGQVLFLFEFEILICKWKKNTSQGYWEK